MRGCLAFVMLLGVLVSGSSARAWEGGADDPPDFYTDSPNGYAFDEEPPAPSFVTLSISPIHLLIPILELQAEVRVLPALGVSVIGGYGRLKANVSGGGELAFDAIELGGQVAYYPSDDFRGLHLGIEVLYLQVDLEDVIGDERVSAVGAGVTVGPLVGYKWISEPGFSVFLQGGFSVAVIKAEAKNDLGERAADEASDVFLLLNLNLGWSF